MGQKMFCCCPHEILFAQNENRILNFTTMAFTITSVRLETINPGQFLDIISNTIPSGSVWKIESAGVGGTKGTIYLRKDLLNNQNVLVPNTKIAILFSSIGDEDYSSVLPFWLPAGFVGTIYNDSLETACVSITICSL